jgi:hypothetical protein
MKLDIKNLANLIVAKLSLLKPYRVLLFTLFVLSLAGYLLLQTNRATNMQPTADQATAITKSTPHIDEAVVEQLQQLQDNSVSVQALFNEARTNPFQ